MSDGELITALLGVIETTKADVLLPVGQQIVPFVLRHEVALRRAIAIAPIPSASAFAIARDKGRLATFCADLQLSHPQSVHFEPGPLFRERLAALRFPALLKPVRASYGRGIERFETADDLMRAVEASPPARECIVQSFVSGYDIDCNVLCKDGEVVACTVQRGIVAGYGRFKPPSAIDFVENEAVRVEAARLIAALKWTGVAHIDMRFDPDEGRAWIIEINPRYWASLLGSLVAGVNFPHLACMAATGAALPHPAFHAARFVAGRAALGAIGARLVRDDQIHARFAETSLAFIAADPGPEIFAGLTRPFTGTRSGKSKRRTIRNRAWKTRNLTA